MHRATAIVAIAALPFACVTACVKRAPAPLGEALVVVDTDVAVPRRVNRMRVEVLTNTGLVVDRREVVTPAAQDWPVSFSVVLPDGLGEGEIFVRLRAYPEGHEISAREIERVSRAKPRNVTVASSIQAACATAPALALASPLTLRRGATPITSLLRAQGCTQDTVSGSAVARLEIVEAGDYRIEITRAVPDAANAEPGSDTAVSLRRECELG